MESIAPMLRDISDQFSVTGQPLATTLAAYCCDVGHLFIVSIGRRVGGPLACSKKAASMELTLEIPIGTAVCETCAERGRPHEPAYKMGMCEFCYKGKPHPRATREQLAKERACARPERSTAFPRR